ncbi:MAG: hypothetical protein MUC85_01895 [Anaerolineales bacterium]|jgi:hypothetical protein|nr:hypothetical protein [Anaerolineales bacterium]
MQNQIPVELIDQVNQASSPEEIREAARALAGYDTPEALPLYQQLFGRMPSRWQMARRMTATTLKILAHSVLTLGLLILSAAALGGSLLTALLLLPVAWKVAFISFALAWLVVLANRHAGSRAVMDRQVLIPANPPQGWGGKILGLLRLGAWLVTLAILLLGWAGFTIAASGGLTAAMALVDLAGVPFTLLFAVAVIATALLGRQMARTGRSWYLAPLWVPGLLLSVQLNPLGMLLSLFAMCLHPLHIAPAWARSWQRAFTQWQQVLLNLCEQWPIVNLIRRLVKQQTQRQQSQAARAWEPLRATK